MNRIDQTRPDAPDLARFGPHLVGVTTRDLVNPDQIDVLAAGSGPRSRHDRHLRVEIWYPAAAGTVPGCTYETLLRDGQTPVVLHGRAARDAVAAGRWPLVILSHGYPGNRMLMAHLGENLASKGYVVASIDHTDSTYADKAAFGSTLVNRSLDTGFVRDALGDLADTDSTAIIGYSMGGYGALISGGAGVAQAALTLEGVAPEGLLSIHCAPVVDPRLKAIVPIGAWGRQVGIWDAAGLAGLSVPALIIAGSADEVSGYDNGMRLIFDEAAGATRHLLTFEHAGHNAAAPMPAPVESWAKSPHLDFVPFRHYADVVWDTLRMNNVAQHFVTAFLDLHLKGMAEQAAYLADDWLGFAPETARGLRFESREKGK